jgi:hypothetical protein
MWRPSPPRLQEGSFLRRMLRLIGHFRYGSYLRNNNVPFATPPHPTRQPRGLRHGPFGLSDDGHSRNERCARSGSELTASSGARRRTPSSSNQKHILLAKTGQPSSAADDHWRRVLIRLAAGPLSSIGDPENNGEWPVRPVARARRPHCARDLGKAMPRRLLRWRG